MRISDKIYMVMKPERRAVIKSENLTTFLYI